MLAERSGLVHKLDERKQHDCHDKEVDDRRDEGTILDVHAEYGQHKILEIGFCNETDERRNNVIGQRGDNIWQILSIISVQKAKKRMPASGIRYKSLEQQETGKNNEDDGDNTEHDVCQTIFLFLLLGAASLCFFSALLLTLVNLFYRSSHKNNTLSFRFCTVRVTEFDGGVNGDYSLSDGSSAGSGVLPHRASK